MSKFIDNIRDSIRVDESEEKKPNRYRGVETFLSGNIGGGAVSWGLLLLGCFAVYAVWNLVVVVLDFFG